MRVSIFILGLIAVGILFGPAARAQGPTGSSGPGKSPRRAGAAPQHDENEPWQFAAGYQYNRDNLLGSPFNTHGVNFSLTRYLKRWLGVEAQVGTGFLGKTGNTTTPPNLDAKSLFVGGGPKIAIPNRTRFEPWGHVLVGFEHYRFSQTAGLLGSNNALAGPIGGGMDIYVTPRTALRVEADALYSRFFAVNQRSFQAIVGVVVNF